MIPGGASGSDGNVLLIVGGEDHKTGQRPEGDRPFARIEEWTRRHFPMCGAMERRWSGEVMKPADGLGYIGRNALSPKNVYVVTGDSGNGMTHGGIAALFIPDLVLAARPKKSLLRLRPLRRCVVRLVDPCSATLQGRLRRLDFAFLASTKMASTRDGTLSGGLLRRENPWTELYDPARKSGLHALTSYARENVNTLAQYGDWFGSGDVSDESEIAVGEGAIIASGLKKMAVYKDEHGDVTRINAMCPHLGGVVRWNAIDRTWDCPCHGSRFNKSGQVFHGPANRDLEIDHRNMYTAPEDAPETAAQGSVIGP